MYVYIYMLDGIMWLVPSLLALSRSDRHVRALLLCTGLIALRFAMLAVDSLDNVLALRT